MLIFDVVLLILLAGFVFYGLFFGLIRTIGSLVALVAGVILASIFYDRVAVWANNFLPGHEVIIKVLVFIFLFVIINRLVSFGFSMLDRLFDLISIIPFLKTINRLAGAIFGFFEGALIIGLGLFALKSYPLIGSWFSGPMATSKIAPQFLNFIDVVKPFLPGVLNALKSLFVTVWK